MAGAGRELERLLANHCAPVFCHRKTANLVAARRELMDALPEVLADSKISWVQLCGCRNYCHILFYDRERLERYLQREGHQSFLKEHGYAGRTMEEQLSLLAERYESYQKQGNPFPLHYTLLQMSVSLSSYRHRRRETGPCGSGASAGRGCQEGYQAGICQHR